MTVLGHFEHLVSVLVGAVEVFQISTSRDIVLNPSRGNLWSYFVFLLFFSSDFQ